MEAVHRVRAGQDGLADRFGQRQAFFAVGEQHEAVARAGRGPDEGAVAGVIAPVPEIKLVAFLFQPPAQAPLQVQLRVAVTGAAVICRSVAWSGRSRIFYLRTESAT